MVVWNYPRWDRDKLSINISHWWTLPGSPEVLPIETTNLDHKIATYNLNKEGEQHIRIILPIWNLWPIVSVVWTYMDNAHVLDRFRIPGCLSPESIIAAVRLQLHIIRVRRAHLQIASVLQSFSMYEFGKLINDQESSFAWLMDSNDLMSDEILIVLLS